MLRLVSSRVPAILAAALSALLCPATAAAQQPGGAPPDEQASRRTFNALPVVFYTPETELGGGAGLLVTARGSDALSEDRPNTCGIFAVYTQKGQTSIQLSPELYLAHGLWKVSLDAGYSKFPSTLHGIGPDAPEEDPEEYTPEAFTVSALAQRRVAAHAFAGFTLAAGRTAIVRRERGGDGIVDPRVQAGRENGALVGAGPVLTHDSRNNIYSPRSGSLHQAGSVYYSPALGSDFTVDAHSVDLRRYVGLAGEHVLAAQAVWRKVGGRVPLRAYPSLGQHVRGIVEGRFQDRLLAAAQVEYRFPVAWRFRGAAFLAGGTVAGTWGAFALADVRAAGGLGVRYALNARERLYLRVDAGVSAEGMEVYFQFGEAF